MRLDVPQICARIAGTAVEVVPTVEGLVAPVSLCPVLLFELIIELPHLTDIRLGLVEQ